MSIQNPSHGPEALLHLIETVHRLRAPGGCPWDRAQTHQSLRQYLIEEAYEVLDILDQIESTQDLKKEKIKSAFQEELGDLLMQILLHSEMTQEAGAFNIYDVAKGLDEKLIRRHPHVFGDQKAESADLALQRWEKEKAKEKASQPNASILDGMPKGLPALQRATRVLEKVTKVGFQWSDLKGPLEKLEEELAEFKTELLALEAAKHNPQTQDNHAQLAEAQRLQKAQSELGDLIFTLCNLAYLLKLSPEAGLRGTLFRFENRFRYVERKLKSIGKSPEQSDLAEMDYFWNEAKKLEAIKVWGLTGGIASGKSTVGHYLSELGIPVVDADLIAKELTQETGKAYQPILYRFGTTDSTRLREIIFNDTQAKKDLESILHPLIQEESQKRIEALAQRHSVVIYEASLLVETGRYKDLNGLIVVSAEPQTRIQRLMQRSQIPLEMANKILASQLSDEERCKHAHFILENSGTLDQLRKQVIELAQLQKWV